MTQHYLIRPQHLNHNHVLFGGQILYFADEVAFITATLKYPNCRFVTKALEATEFNSPVSDGDILAITGEVISVGRTSCRVRITAQNQTSKNPVFSTDFVMVNVIAGQKTPISNE